MAQGYLWQFPHLDYSLDVSASYGHKSKYSPENEKPQVG